MISARRNVIRAPRLHRGDLLRVISPSLPSLAYSRGSLDGPIGKLAELGLRCDFAAHAFEITDDGRSAGPPEVRAADLHAAFLDPDVAGVLCAVGGLSSHELLPHLDAGLIRAHPKPLIGRSDNTYLSAFLLERAGLTSFSGATFVTQFGESDVAAQTTESFASVLLGDRPTRLVTSSRRTENSRPGHYTGEVHHWAVAERPGTDVWLRPGRASGRLVGGEIGIVADLIADDMLTIDGAVFWIDVVDDGAEYFAEQLDRLAPLVAGSDVAALVVADNPSVPFDEWVTTVREALPRLARSVAGPVLLGGDVGHYQPAWMLPYGDIVEVDSASGVTITL